MFSDIKYNSSDKNAAYWPPRTLCKANMQHFILNGYEKFADFYKLLRIHGFQISSNVISILCI